MSTSSSHGATRQSCPLPRTPSEPKRRRRSWCSRMKRSVKSNRQHSRPWRQVVVERRRWSMNAEHPHQQAAAAVGARALRRWSNGLRRGNRRAAAVEGAREHQRAAAFQSQPMACPRCSNICRRSRKQTATVCARPCDAGSADDRLLVAERIISYITLSRIPIRSSEHYEHYTACLRVRYRVSRI